MSDVTYEVAIIGGGPAGSTAASALARHGVKVALCEQVAFPRFHIGESLLPAGNELFRSIGVWEQIEAAGFVRKAGAEFETADGSKHVHNVFENGLIDGQNYTYQVERSRFDALLLDHARKCGATIFQPVGVTSISSGAEHWTLQLSNKQRLTAHYIIDASGRQTVLARTLKLPKRELSYPRKIALYSQFSGLPRASGSRAGNIIITRWQDGWFWQIPLDGERTSVGLVSMLTQFKDFEGSHEEFFHSVVTATPVLAQRFECAKRLDDFHVTTDYTYMYEQFAGDRFLLAGDAACFIDPVFSSGVYLAMQSGYAAANHIFGASQQNKPLSKRIQKTYTDSYVRRVDVMRGLIDTFYDRRGIEVFLNPSNRWKLFDAVNSVVAGNTHLSWRVRWRYYIFLTIVKLHQRWGRLVPNLNTRALGRSKLCKRSP